MPIRTHVLNIALLACLASSAHAAQPQAGHQLLHRADLESARAAGAEVVEDYGAVLWVRSGSAKAVAAEDAQTFALELGQRRFDPASDSAAAQRIYGDVPALRLVQFAAPPRQAWLDALVASGATPLQYIAPYSYVVWGSSSALENAARTTPQLRFRGEFLPQYKQNAVAAGVRSGETQWHAMLARAASVDDTTLARAGAEVTGRSITDGAFETISFQIQDAATLTRLAALPGVYSLQPVRRDGGLRGELAQQITANNFNGSNLPVVGYRPWLAGIGVNGSGVIIANVDGGIFHTHPDLVGRMLPCVGDTCGGAATDAHGTHTAAIMAGDGASGVVDANGFLRGLGMAPGANLIEQKYSPTFTQAGGMLKLMRQSHDNNAALSGNSWGPAGSPVGYDGDTRQVDVGVRDTKPDVAGDQPLTYVLSFMNGNGGTSSQGSPDEAKNVITVGSTKAQTSAGVFIPDYNDLSSNSAHGPALDGRRIPHLVAPGCSVDSASSATGYARMCGTSMASPQVAGAVALFIEQYRDNHAGASPSSALIKAALVAASQNLRGFDDADGGVLATRPDNKQGWGRLRADWLLAPGVAVRYVDQTTRTFDNTGESWTLTVSPDDPAKPVQVVLVYTDAPGHGTGGSTPAWNNDLDLRVSIGASVYRGNVFNSTGFSTTGGTADNRNNIESVVLDAATAAGGGLAIEVVATSINANALPNSGDATDQDFALVCINCAVGPSFSLAAEPPVQQRCGPGAVSWDIDVGSNAGYTGSVALSAANVPSPATTSFSPASVAAPGSSTLTLTTGALADGSYLIDVNGSDGNTSKLTQVGLDYNSAIAAAPTLTAPANASTGVTLKPQLSWQAAANPATVLGYRVEVDNNSDFSSPVFSLETAANVTQATLPNNLAAYTVYYWRVIALNSCGDSVAASRSFTTAALYCAEPALAIPDGSGNLTSTISVPAGASAIADLDIVLAASHPRIGDLAFNLSRSGSAATASLLDRPGVPATTLGCAGDNFDIVLDDEEPTRTAEANCTSATPAYTQGATYQPNSPLSVFDGSSASGSWTLTASDLASGSTGSLQRWCLLATFPLGADERLFQDGFE